MALRSIELFAGGGGLALGLKMVGVRTVCFVEREAFAAATLVRQMEQGGLAPCPVWTDVCTFDGRPWRGVVDLVAGGFPCQDVSNAGKRAGISGERSGLWSEFARIVREVGPSYVFVENVAALAHRGLDRVVGDLAALGFDAEWGCLGADDTGAPHGRERIFVLAYAGGIRHERPEIVGELEGDGSVLPGETLADSPRPLVRQEPSAWVGRSPGTDGAGVAHANDGRRRERAKLSEPQCEAHGRGLPTSCDRGAMAHAAGSGGDGRGSQRPMVGASPTERPKPRGGGVSLAHSDEYGLTGEQIGTQSRCDAHRRRCPWPPAPGDADAWREYLNRWPGLEPAVRRGANGVARRVDRLRLLGNGVVPDQAALAFRVLWERLHR